MNFNFELILFYAVIVCGLITLFDVLFFSSRRRTVSVIITYAREFFPVLLIVFLLRSFLYEPYRIPSGSLKPTLLVGDFILVNKYDYGIRLPVFHKKIWAIDEPKHGDIVVFREPPNQTRNLIKRVIGVPGDNRDDSADSRSWGFMPEENIIGKANRVLLSWDTIKHPIRWDRIGMKIN